MTLPEGSIPATQNRNDENLVLFNYFGETNHIPIEPQQHEIDTFQGFLSTQAQWAKDLSSNWSSSDRDDIINVLQHGNSPILIAVDSTINRHYGNYTVVLGSDNQIIFENKGRVLQTQETVQSIRM